MSEVKCKRYMGEIKRKRTFEDLISEGFAKERDLLELRNILINSNILIKGNRSSGLPLLMAFVFELLREEINTPFKVIFETDNDYSCKIDSVSVGTRVIFQDVSCLSTFSDAEKLINSGIPVILCSDNDFDTTMDICYFDYIIQMTDGLKSGVKEIISVS